jgi:hypothetical protein
MKNLCDFIRCFSAVIAGLASLIAGSENARADQGGVSFWVPGFFGSFAASPQTSGFNLAMIYYHTSVGAGGGVAAAKQVEIGQLRPTLNVNLDVNLNGRADLGFIIPSHVFDTKIFGGQFAVSVLAAYGRNSATIDGTLSASLGPLTVTRQGSISDSITAFGDLTPQASLRWNAGVHNVMIYGTTNIRVGSYESTRLANTGLGFNAWDGGIGYTYLDPAKGYEFSITAGATYNNWNHDTNYKNGIDYHIDFGAAQFLNKQFYVGAVGYIYNQFTADEGAPAFLGEVQSRVYGVGPQLGYIFQAAPGVQGVFNVKGYYEFDAQNRPDGWNLWATLAFSPAQQQEQAVSKPRPIWK